MSLTSVSCPGLGLESSRRFRVALDVGRALLLEHRPRCVGLAQLGLEHGNGLGCLQQLCLRVLQFEPKIAGSLEGEKTKVEPTMSEAEKAARDSRSSASVLAKAIWAVSQPKGG